MYEENPLVVFNCLLVGDSGTGKTAFIKRHLTGEFYDKCIGTPGAQISPLIFYTNRGVIHFDVWDTAGHEKYADLRSYYYKRAQCAIIMFDVTSHISYKNVCKWYSDLQRVCANVPIVLCGNKIDKQDRKVCGKNIEFYGKKNMPYYAISVKLNYNFEKPFLRLSRMLFRDRHLQFIAMPAFLPLNIQMGKEWYLYIEEKLKEAKEKALPDEDDDL